MAWRLLGRDIMSKQLATIDPAALTAVTGGNDSDGGLDASAFSGGEDIVAGDLGSSRDLLAHEVAHPAQQRSGSTK